MKEIKTRAGVHVNIGNVYRELGRLMRDGFVRSTPNPPGADPRRAPYEATEAGVKAFDDWLAVPERGFPPCNDDLWARALFICQTEAAVGRKVVDRWREELTQRGKGLEEARDLAVRNERADEAFTILPYFLSRQLRHVAVDAEFVEELRQAHERCSTPAPTPHAGHRPPISARGGDPGERVKRKA
jgi:DNA-binding PadR family transcriptional regulator